MLFPGGWSRRRVVSMLINGHTRELYGMVCLSELGVKFLLIGRAW